MILCGLYKCSLLRCWETRDIDDIFGIPILFTVSVSTTDTFVAKLKQFKAYSYSMCKHLTMITMFHVLIINI